MSSTKFVYVPFRNIDILEKCEDFEMDEKAKLQEGWIYMMSNPSLQGMVKIGVTTTSPEQRCKELSSSTSIPTPFELVVAYHVDTPYEVERSVHERLNHLRVSQNREFFNATKEDLINAMEDWSLHEHGNCKIDVLLSEQRLCLDKFKHKNKTVKITEDAYDSLISSHANADDLAEMAIRFMFKHLTGNIVYQNGRFTVLPDPCYNLHEDKCPDEYKPKLIKEIKLKIDCSEAEF